MVRVRRWNTVIEICTLSVEQRRCKRRHTDSIAILALKLVNNRKIVNKNINIKIQYALF